MLVRQLEPRLRRWIVPATLFLGLALRSYHYLRDRAVWQDEAGLLLTVTARDFNDLLLGRLDYHQAAPPLYLCALKVVNLAWGDSSYALRLLSFLASCAAMVLLVPVARRLLAPPAIPWALLLFACSEQLLWHASEAKAYSIDVLAAVMVLAVPCWRWLHSLPRQLLAYTMLAPPLLLFSYPACFLCAGVLIAYWPAVHTQKQLRTWLAYSGLAVVTGAVMLWVVLGPARIQHDAEIHSCWVACMPRWEEPWTVPSWMILSSFEVCRYCCKPLGQILAILAVPGGLVLWRRGERTALLILTVPIVLAFAGACVHRYPFGGARVMVFAAPAVLLLGAAGVPPALTWLSAGTGWFSVALTGLLILPLASALWQVVHPWREADIPAAAEYVEAQRRPEDRVLGNDVAQRYYFRHFGAAFDLLEGTPPPPRSDRLWIVMTAALPRGERLRLAYLLAPSGWQALQQREFAYTTVVLFGR